MKPVLTVIISTQATISLVLMLEIIYNDTHLRFVSTFCRTCESLLFDLSG